MQYLTFKICPISQNKEEYICTNKNCVKQSKKHLHCYPCLTKMHRDKKQNINHIDDFLDIAKVMQIVSQKREQRVQYLEQMQLKSIDFQKEKVQQIQKYPFYSQEILNEAIDKVEGLFKQFSIFLGEHFQNANKANIYNSESHNLVFELYFSNEVQYRSTISQKLEQVIIDVNEYLKQQDFDVHDSFLNQKKKFQNIEGKLAKLEKPITIVKVIQQIIFVLVVVIFSNQFNNFAFNSNQKINQECIGEEYVNQIIKLKIEELRTEIFNENSNKKLEELPNEIEYIKLFNQKLKIEILELQRWVKDSFQDQKLFNINIQSETQNYKDKLEIHETFIATMKKTSSQKYSTIDLKDQATVTQQLQYLDQSITQIDQKLNTTFDKVKEFTEYKIEMTKLYFDAQYYLVGRIHEDYPFILLQGFKKYYDELFSVSFTVEKIVNLNLQFDRRSIVCIGGGSIHKPNRFELMACDYAFEVFGETFSTTKARKSRTGSELFWYLVRNHSIGFAPTEDIDLRLTDQYDLKDQKRFSHLLDHPHGGGRRIGNQTTLAYSEEHKLVIFVLE